MVMEISQNSSAAQQYVQKIFEDKIVIAKQWIRVADYLLSFFLGGRESGYPLP